MSMLRLKQRLEDVRTELTHAQSIKDTMERRVYLLRPDSLDLDMLEERARAVLNFAKPSEVIIFEDADRR